MANLPGVRVTVESARKYAEGRLVAHLLGYLGPISPAVLSQAEYDMPPRPESFLSDAWFADEVLTPAQRARVESVARGGDALAQRVVDWCLENLIPLTRSDLSGRLVLTYEELSANPAAALRAAQIEMWKRKRLSSPYYWAGFVLQGEWK